MAHLEGIRIGIYDEIRNLSDPVEVRIELRNLCDLYINLMQFKDAIMNQPLAYLAKPGLHNLKVSAQARALIISHDATTEAGRQLSLNLYFLIMHVIELV